MKKIKEKEYIRTYKGTVSQIKDIDFEIKYRITTGKPIFFNEKTSEFEDVDKSSFELRELILKGDYVNGYPVREINGKLCNFDLNNMEWIPLEEIDVWESIVTKEQMEDIQYVIE